MNIWINGCFDILHTGHLDLLWHAKLYGTEDLFFDEGIKYNKLFIGLDSDERVRQLKGNKRPINNVDDRLRMLGNLRMVDSVTIFHNDDELRYLIKEFKIDYIIVGDQYKDKEVIGAEHAKYDVVYYPVDDRSTTNIIKKIKNL